MRIKLSNPLVPGAVLALFPVIFAFSFLFFLAIGNWNWSDVTWEGLGHLAGVTVLYISISYAISSLVYAPVRLVVAVFVGAFWLLDRKGDPVLNWLWTVAIITLVLFILGLVLLYGNLFNQSYY